MKRGKDKGTAASTFEIDGTEYVVTWESNTTRTPTEATLASPSFADPVTGIEDLRLEVFGLLGMDADDFSSAVSVKQVTCGFRPRELRIVGDVLGDRPSGDGQ